MAEFPSWWAAPGGASMLFQNPPVPDGWLPANPPGEADTLPTPKVKHAPVRDELHDLATNSHAGDPPKAKKPAKQKAPAPKPAAPKAPKPTKWKWK